MERGYLINNSVLHGKEEWELARMVIIWQHLLSVPLTGSSLPSSIDEPLDHSAGCQVGRAVLPAITPKELGREYGGSPRLLHSIVIRFHFTSAKLLEQHSAFSSKWPLTWICPKFLSQGLLRAPSTGPTCLQPQCWCRSDFDLRW